MTGTTHATVAEVMEAATSYLEGARDAVIRILEVEGTDEHPTLHGVRGPAARRVRDELTRAVHNDFIRWGYGRTYAGELEKRINFARGNMSNPDTPSLKRIANALDDDLQTLAKGIEERFEAVKAAEEAERRSARERWPRPKGRLEKLEGWGKCVAHTLDFYENLVNADAEFPPVDKIDRDTLVDYLQRVAVARQDIAEEMDQVVGRLDEGDYEGAWIVLFMVTSRFTEGELER